MEQLEVRAYKRQEIAEIMKLKINSKNFLRDVKIRLDAWGYDYKTPWGGAIIITRRPETAQERLAEIMIRMFGLDIQIKTTDFACFLHFMLNEPAAQTMPWKERHNLIQEMYGLDISEITLRRWAKHLVDGEIMHKSQGKQDSEWWMTYNIDGKKRQEPVADEDISQVHGYWKRHGEILSEMLIQYHGNKVAAWKATGEQMWQEFGCCYYRCRCIMINGIGNEEINHIVDLVDDILDLHWDSSNVDQT